MTADDVVFVVLSERDRARRCGVVNSTLELRCHAGGRKTAERYNRVVAVSCWPLSQPTPFQTDYTCLQTSVSRVKGEKWGAWTSSDVEPSEVFAGSKWDVSASVVDVVLRNNTTLRSPKKSTLHVLMIHTNISGVVIALRTTFYSAVCPSAWPLSLHCDQSDKCLVTDLSPSGHTLCTPSRLFLNSEHLSVLPSLSLSRGDISDKHLRLLWLVGQRKRVFSRWLTNL
jgi:hypothetical protein